MRQVCNVFLSSIKYLAPIFIFFLLTSQSVSGQTTDSTATITESVSVGEQNTAASGEYVDDDFAPGLAFMVMLAGALMLAAIGAGIVLTVLVLVAIFGLIFIGLLSASTLVGLHQKSFASGFKTFVVSMSGVGGVALCALVFFVVNVFVKWCSTTTAVLAGAGFGLVSGLLFGVVVSYVLIWFTGFLKEQLTKVRSS